MKNRDLLSAEILVYSLCIYKYFLLFQIRVVTGGNNTRVLRSASGVLTNYSHLSENIIYIFKLVPDGF